MNIEDYVLNHLIDVVTLSEPCEFQINSISYSGFKENWDSLEPKVRKRIGKLFKDKVNANAVTGVSFKETLSDNHSVYIKK